MAIVVMGVSGAGKSTIAEELAHRIGGRYLDADDLHPPANVAKMAAGIPLTDDDRMPWLAAVGDAIAAATQAGEAPVVACSALRRRYRDALRATAPEIFFVHLDGPADLLAARLHARADHFMPAALLSSQLATLEPLDPDERGTTIEIGGAPDEIVTDAAARWRAIAGSTLS